MPSGSPNPILKPLRRAAGSMLRFFRYLRADRYTRRYHWAGGNYRWIFDHLAKDGVGRSNPGALIIEVGARDCLDAIELHGHFAPAMVYAFEPSRPGISRSLEVLRDFPAQSDAIMLCPFALGETSGTAMLYEFTLKEKSSGYVNIGCSSLYPWTSRNHQADSWVKGIEEEQAVQHAYAVPIFRADDLDFLKDRPVLLTVVDVEGAELAFLKGAETLLRNTQYLCLEAGYHLPRDGEAADARLLVDYLAARGWEMLCCNATGDASLPPDPGYLTQFDLLLRNRALRQPV